MNPSAFRPMAIVDEVTAMLVVHVDDIKIAANKKSRVGWWQISIRDS